MAFRSEIVAVSTTINCELALSAYQKGIFPWPVDDEFVFWYSPNRRGIIFTDKFNPDKDLLKQLTKHGQISYRFNFNVANELEKCRNYHLSKHGQTWLTEKMIKFYLEALNIGNFFSLTAFANNMVCGSIFCVRINNYISAETMYSETKGGSKVALFGLVRYLSRFNISFLDVQVLNSLTFKLGGEEVSKRKFVELLKTALSSNDLMLVESFWESY
ncbi:MAG: hypothetical protein NZT61_02935 [Deltaproteobacteria bacterium]|nr:hypothetical protein [Deltaproteobacteria bacterium]MCX7952399.1 hypothetical protein [Deltaproteobacteria bacterium]